MDQKRPKIDLKSVEIGLKMDRKCISNGKHVILPNSRTCVRKTAVWIHIAFCYWWTQQRRKLSMRGKRWLLRVPQSPITQCGMCTCPVSIQKPWNSVDFLSAHSFYQIKKSALQICRNAFAIHGVKLKMNFNKTKRVKKGNLKCSRGMK